jgi:hypothetical protein
MRTIWCCWRERSRRPSRRGSVSKTSLRLYSAVCTEALELPVPVPTVWAVPNGREGEPPAWLAAHAAGRRWSESWMRETRTSSSMRGRLETCDSVTRLRPTLPKPLPSWYVHAFRVFSQLMSDNPKRPILMLLTSHWLLSFSEIPHGSFSRSERNERRGSGRDFALARSLVGCLTQYLLKKNPATRGSELARALCWPDGKAFRCRSCLGARSRRTADSVQP